ncbi:helix-turn-helix domain-containing protein [Oerskovia sp. M15]
MGAATDTPRLVSVPVGRVGLVARYTTFQMVADPTVEQARVLARHEGAARFAFNQGLRLHLNARRASTDAARAAAADDGDGDGAAVKVPWTGFDLINAFNTWKKSEQAGRRFVVASCGVAGVEVTGLAWRTQVSAQVFEEAVVDLGKALRAWTDSRRGKRAAGRSGIRGSRRRTTSVARSACGTRSLARRRASGPRSGSGRTAPLGDLARYRRRSRSR